MIPIDRAVIARLSSHGHHFEVLVDPEQAWRVKGGDTKVSLDDVLVSREIYKDSAKGERASEETLMEVFETLNTDTVIRTIIKKGEIQITTEQRRKMQEERRKQVVNMIAREAVDPRTNTPHPAIRIERAMEEARVHVDPFRSAQSQVPEVVDKLRLILPIKFAKVRVAIKVSPEYTGKAYGYIHDLKTLKEEWGNDGSLLALIEVPAGMQSEIYDELNSMTHGNVEAKILKTI
jgi:ribosome maturation protein SDO1